MATAISSFLEAKTDASKREWARELVTEPVTFQLRVSQHVLPFTEFCPHCPHRLTMDVLPRPANALNIEVGTPSPRCALKSPDGLGARWYLSGGSILAYGHCSFVNCELYKPNGLRHE